MGPYEYAQAQAHRPKRPPVPHYNRGNVQPIDLIIAQGLNFCEGSIVKYICRWQRKGTPMADLEKARDYLDWLMEMARALERNPQAGEPKADPRSPNGLGTNGEPAGEGGSFMSVPPSPPPS